jgi:hypothetical protein
VIPRPALASRPAVLRMTPASSQWSIDIARYSGSRHSSPSGSRSSSLHHLDPTPKSVHSQTSASSLVGSVPGSRGKGVQVSQWLADSKASEVRSPIEFVWYLLRHGRSIDVLPISR